MKKCVSLILFILAALNSHVSLGQKSRMSKSFQGDVIRYRAGTGTYSMKSKYSTPLYKGYEISLGLNQSSLRSGIPQLDKLKMTYLGTNLGFVVASSYAKLKTTLGYYESEPSVPYTMNMMQATVCGGVYPLRFLRAKYRTLINTLGSMERISPTLIRLVRVTITVLPVSLQLVKQELRS